MSNRLEQANAEIELTLADYSTREWLKTALRELIERDVCDALNDVEELHKLIKARTDAVLYKE